MSGRIWDILGYAKCHEKERDTHYRALEKGWERGKDWSCEKKRKNVSMSEKTENESKKKYWSKELGRGGERESEEVKVWI